MSYSKPLKDQALHEDKIDLSTNLAWDLRENELDSGEGSSLANTQTGAEAYLSDRSSVRIDDTTSDVDITRLKIGGKGGRPRNNPKVLHFFEFRGKLKNKSRQSKKVRKVSPKTTSQENNEDNPLAIIPFPLIQQTGTSKDNQNQQELVG